MERSVYGGISQLEVAKVIGWPMWTTDRDIARDNTSWWIYEFPEGAFKVLFRGQWLERFETERYH